MIHVTGKLFIRELCFRYIIQFKFLPGATTSIITVEKRNQKVELNSRARNNKDSIPFKKKKKRKKEKEIWGRTKMEYI